MAAVKWAKVEAKDAGAAMAVSQAAGRWNEVDSAEAVKVATGKAGQDAGWQAILEAVRWAKVEVKDAGAAMAVSQVAVKGAGAMGRWGTAATIPRSG